MGAEEQNTQIVMMVGGEGKRMGINSAKALVKLGDDTLLNRCVKVFIKNGFSNFVFILGYQDKEVTAYIDQCDWKDAHVEKVYDYAKGIGKGKAFKHALMEGKIKKTMRTIFVWPDDIFVDPGLPAKVFQEHLRAVKKFGIFVSDIVETAHRYPMGVVKADDNGLVKEFEEKPLIPLLVSTGMRIFEPQTYKYFIDLIDLNKEGSIEFEYAILPQLAKEGKVYAVKIPPDSWVQINTQKELEQAEKLVAKGVLPKKIV